MTGEAPLRERVARAMHAAIGTEDREDTWVDDYNDGSDVYVDGPVDFLALADGALAEVRRVTDSMLNGAREWSAKEYGKPIGNDAAKGCWDAMWAAAMKQETL